jgi:hypothetical protein
MPTRAGYAYEPKLDGFRCLIRTEGAFEVRTRRFWNMTALLPELEAIPARGIFDGELIAFTGAKPDFVALTDRVLLTRDQSIPIAFVAFDVLSLEGDNVMRRPYWQIHERTLVVLATTTVAVALLGVTSAAAASSDATGGAAHGRVVFHCDPYARLGPPGPPGALRRPVHGQCTITGAIADRGRFADNALPCANPHVRTVNARKGTIRIEVYRKRGNWMLLGGTKAYRGLRGHGWESSNIRCKGPGPRTTPIKMVGTVSH